MSFTFVSHAHPHVDKPYPKSPFHILTRNEKYKTEHVIFTLPLLPSPVQHLTLRKVAAIVPTVPRPSPDPRPPSPPDANMTTTPQQLPDPVAHAVAAIPIPRTTLLVLLCLFIVIFIRITHFTLSKNHEYAITRSVRCQHRQAQAHEPSSSRPHRKMTASWASVGFNTLTPPRCSLYSIPSLVFANNTLESRISAPLLVRQEHKEQIESVEMDSVAVKAEKDWEDYSALNGTNKLNTPWSWTA